MGECDGRVGKMLSPRANFIPPPSLPKRMAVGQNVRAAPHADPAPPIEYEVSIFQLLLLLFYFFYYFFDKFITPQKPDPHPLRGPAKINK